LVKIKPEIRSRSVKIYLVLSLVIFFSFFYKLGAPLLFDRDEGAFSEATREMLQRGDYVSTWLNDEPRYDKPILIYWLQALSIKLWGLNELAVRFPSAIAASIWIWAIFIFVRKRFDLETAAASALFASTSLWMIIIGRAAIADALLNLFIALSLFDLYRYFESDSKHQLWRVFIWAALGALTKGPIAVLIPFSVSLIFFVFRGQWRRWLKAVLNPVGILIFGIIALPWYLFQYHAQGMSFINGFFFKHNVQRFISPLEGHGGSFIYYVPMLLLIIFPFSGLFIRIFSFVRRVRTDPFDLFLWLWFGFVMIFFTISGTKLPHYLLHGCTPLFILMAVHRQRFQSKLLAIGPVFLFWILLVLLPEFVEQLIPVVKDELAVEMMHGAKQYIDMPFRLLNIGMAILSLVLFLPFKLPVWQRLSILGIAGAFVITHSLIPTYGKIQQGAIRQAAELLSSRTEQVVMWGLDNPSFSFYRRQVTPWREPMAGEIVVTRRSRLAKLPDHEILYQKGGIIAAKIKEKND
jgi:4-amino-4-deoxy-L-arabinose transferase-like glycosyltransferase